MDEKKGILRGKVNTNMREVVETKKHNMNDNRWSEKIQTGVGTRTEDQGDAP